MLCTIILFLNSHSVHAKPIKLHFELICTSFNIFFTLSLKIAINNKENNKTITENTQSPNSFYQVISNSLLCLSKAICITKKFLKFIVIEFMHHCLKDFKSNFSNDTNIALILWLIDIAIYIILTHIIVVCTFMVWCSSCSAT